MKTCRACHKEKDEYCFYKNKTKDRIGKKGYTTPAKVYISNICIACTLEHAAFRRSSIKKAWVKKSEVIQVSCDQPTKSYPIILNPVPFNWLYDLRMKEVENKKIYDYTT